MRAALRRLPAFQAQAASMMTLTLAAYSPGTSAEDGDGFDVRTPTLVGSTVGKVQGGSLAGADTGTRFVRIGEVDKAVLEGGLHIPLAAPIPSAGRWPGDGWEYLVTAVGAHDDPALLGRRFLVVSVPAKSFATARRLDVVEI